MVGAVGTFDGLGFDELQGSDGALQVVDDELFGQIAGLDLAEGRPFLFLFYLVFEADQFAGGGHLHAKLFLLEAARPAVAPAPQAHGMADQLVGAFQTELAFQEGFCQPVVLEYGAMAIVAQVEAAVAEKGAGLVARLIAGYLEIDRCFGERLVEEGDADRQADDGDEQTGDEELDVFAGESLFHGLLPCLRRIMVCGALLAGEWGFGRRGGSATGRPTVRRRRTVGQRYGALCALRQAEVMLDKEFGCGDFYAIGYREVAINSD